MFQVDDVIQDGDGAAAFPFGGLAAQAGKIGLDLLLAAIDAAFQFRDLGQGGGIVLAERRAADGVSPRGVDLHRGAGPSRSGTLRASSNKHSRGNRGSVSEIAPRPHDR